MGWFDRHIERGCEKALDDFRKTRLPELARKIFAEIISGPEFRFFGFIKAIQRHLQEADSSISDKKAFELARLAYWTFLNDEKIEYGDPRYSWDDAAAKEIAVDYEIDHWDTAG